MSAQEAAVPCERCGGATRLVTQLTPLRGVGALIFECTRCQHYTWQDWHVIPRQRPVSGAPAGEPQPQQQQQTQALNKDEPET